MVSTISTIGMSTVENLRIEVTKNVTKQFIVPVMSYPMYLWLESQCVKKI